PQTLAIVPTEYKLTVAFDKAGEKKVIDSFVEKGSAFPACRRLPKVPSDLIHRTPHAPDRRQRPDLRI
ncbi:MAG TPA: hypothetical protein PLG07_14850, partial [Phenylobacterium sp.]|nr:hypothetical protein [Phenylobacterium sp.]